MIKFKNVEKIIKEYQLIPATSRDFPLLTFDCIVLGYTKLLKKYLDFSYNAMAALGGGNKFQTLFNEADVAEKTDKFIEKNYRQFNKKIFLPINKVFNQIKQQVGEIEKMVDFKPNYYLKIIAEIYPRYMSILGIYNCFWRYIGNEESKGKLSPVLVKRLGVERDRIAKLYPKIEKLICLTTSLIGKRDNFDGDLLRSFTVDELKSYLKRQKITKSTLKNLAQRRKKYFYLYIEKSNKKYIFTDKNILKKIYNNFYKIKTKTSLLQGYAVYPGRAKGLVYNLEQQGSYKPTSNFILIASTTHPKTIMLIKKSLAVVTDEGGILSHAAIVCRELKKPCIIGTKIASKILKNNDLVEVDAHKGTVKILK